MKESASSVFPSSDLLDQVSGVDRALQTGRRLGALGWLAIALSLVQAGVALTTSRTADAIRHLNWGQLAHEWPVWTFLGLLVLGIILRNWTRFWVRESESPFRYTFSIAEFEPIGETRGFALPWLREDLCRKLSERIKRLFRLDDANLPKNPGGQDRSHIHISGTFGLRELADGTWSVDVRPWVHIGDASASARLAHSVSYRLQVKTRHASSAKLDPNEYEKLVERVYFSVATEIYKQIRENVQRKIDLLPRSFRAAAYFYEAQDYAGSNTLDAYDHARDLYQRVIATYDPAWTPLATSRWWRLVMRAMEAKAALRRGVALKGSTYWPRLAAVELVLAKAYIGYSNALIYRRLIAGLSGQRVNPVFETRPAIMRAFEHLQRIPDHVPGKREAVFDATVTKALVLAELDAPVAARKALEDALFRDPLRAEQDSRFLFVQGHLEPRLVPRLHRLERAVEIDPGYEVAQYELATTSEMLWRTRRALEPEVASAVCDQYDRVVNINPGNTAGWANLGFVCWLLDDLITASRHYDRGREYKDIKRTTFVAQLDYGLARINAEQGRFDLAYRHYIDGVSARSAQGVSHVRYTAGHEYQRVGQAMVNRFELYRSRVHAHWEAARIASGASRLRDAVYAFVLTDYADACFSFYLRTADETFRDKARDAYRLAVDLGPRQLMPRYSMHKLSMWDIGRDYLGQEILEVNNLDSQWADGNLELVLFRAEKRHRDAVATKNREARRLLEEARADRQVADNWRKQAADLRSESLAKPAPRKPDLLPSPRTDTGSASGPPLGAAEDYLSQEITTLPSTIGGFDSQAELAVKYERLGDAEEEKVQRKLEQIRSLRSERTVLLAQASEFDRRATEVMRTVLPHDWLWHLTGTGQSTIDLALFKEPSLVGRYRWERDLDELHVRALSAWSVDQPDVDRQLVVGCLREHFWPEEFQLLQQARELCQPNSAERESISELLRTLLQLYLDEEPAYWNMAWVLALADESPRQESDHAAAVLIKATSQQRLAPSLMIWLAQELEKLERKDEAVKKYRAALGQLRAEARPDLVYAAAQGMRSCGAWAESAQAYSDAVTQFNARGTEHQAAIADCHLGAAQSLWSMSQFESALDELAAIGANGRSGWRKELITTLGEADAHQFWLLRTWLDKEVRRFRRMAEPDREDAQAALLRLRLRHEDRGAPYAYRGWEPIELPILSPLRLEADPAFFPQGENTPQVRRMLRSNGEARGGIDKIRDRIQASFGIRVPGVRMRSDYAIPSQTYQILIDEVPVHAAEANPVGEYDRDMLLALETVLRENLHRFVGFQEVSQLLDEWQGLDPAREQLRKQGLPDARSQVRFVRVVRALLAEQIPISGMNRILEIFKNQPGIEIDEAVEHVRAIVDSESLGLKRKTSLTPVPYELERKLTTHLRGTNGGRRLDLTPDEDHEVREELARCVSGGGASDVALVLRDSSLRPFVRRLVAEQYPAVHVVTSTEIGPLRRRQLLTNDPVKPPEANT